MPHEIVTIDTAYADREELAAAYLLTGGDEVAFVETNTTAAVPALLQALDRAGYRPEQVRYVAITHIHLDHAGGAGALMAACPNATLLAHPKAAPHAVDPSRIVAGATQVYGEEAFAALYGEVVPVPTERVRVLEDGDSVALGGREITAWHTRGHANHHFVLQDHGADTVFTGDSFGLLYPALQRHGPFVVPSTTPTDFDPQAAHDSVDRILALGTSTVHPTHFGAHTVDPRMGEQLHRLLDGHAALVTSADRDGLEGAALDAYCHDGVRSLLAGALEQAGFSPSGDEADLLAMDAQLNAQGLAFAVRKRRYKRSKAAE